ncbi:hypothetical protein ASZ78_013434, partial [Callipepla squamata]
VTVSSGGMLVQKLNVADLQSGSGTFDGTMVYAQNKHFFCNHKSLAWQPTIPLFSLAVRSSMPDFYQKMKNSLRTEAQGADTVVWLALSSEAAKLPSGLFFQGKSLLLHINGVCLTACKVRS